LEKIKRFNSWKPPEIKHNILTKWNWMVQNPDKLEIGRHSDIGAFTYINAHSGVIIAEEVQIGSHCSIYSISTIDNKQGTVTIQKNARIGSHTTIMPGVTIGSNAVVGAHSFVNKDIPPGAIAYGVPVKIKKGSENE
jgi:acetyltransferase-like isoleucine patch superfamily enzyme